VNAMTEPVARAGTRRTATEVVDITDEGDDGGDSRGRRIKTRLEEGPGGSTDDAIVVD
jgi:hypothetical protein